MTRIGPWSSSKCFRPRRARSTASPSSRNTVAIPACATSYVDPDTVSAKLYSRGEGGEWIDADLIGADASIALTAIDVALPLGALYDRIEWPSEAARV